MWQYQGAEGEQQGWGGGKGVTSRCGDAVLRWGEKEAAVEMSQGEPPCDARCTCRLDDMPM